jgi:hypothetical protein
MHFQTQIHKQPKPNNSIWNPLDLVYFSWGKGISGKKYFYLKT